MDLPPGVMMFRHALAALVVILAAATPARAQVIYGPLRPMANTLVHTDSGGNLGITGNVVCASGCAGGTSDTDDGTVAGGQSTGIAINLSHLWNGVAWVRMPGDAANGLKVNCTSGCAGAATVVTTSGTLIGAGGTVDLTLAGNTGAGAQLDLTGFSGQLKVYVSFDGVYFFHQTTWGELLGGATRTRTSVLETAKIGMWIFVPPGATHVRIYAAALTAGTVAVTLNGNNFPVDPVALAIGSQSLTDIVDKSIQIGGTTTPGNQWHAAEVVSIAPGDAANGLVVRNRSAVAAILTGPATSSDGLGNVLVMRDATGGTAMEPQMRTDAALIGDRGILVRPIPSATLPQLVSNTAGSFPVQATLAAETTKVIGTVNQGTSSWIVNLITGFALSTTQTDRTQKTQISDGTRDGTVKAASTLPLLTDTAVVTTQRDPIPAGTNLVGKFGIDQTTPGTTNRVDVGTFPANQPFNIAQINGVTPLMGVGASGTGAPRVAALIQDGVDIANVTTDGSLQAEPPRTNYVAFSGQESVAAGIADTWYIRRQWALPTSAHFTPSAAWATVTTALTKTVIGVANSLGTLNVGTNAFAAVNSVGSPFFYGRLFGCVTTVLSATLDTVTPTYTDELGNSQATAGVAFASGLPVGNCMEFPLATGALASTLDAGVRAVTAAVDTAATTGVITFYGVNVLADFAGTAANQTESLSFPQIPELNANEQIVILMRQAAVTAQLKTFGVGGSLR